MFKTRGRVLPFFVVNEWTLCAFIRPFLFVVPPFLFGLFTCVSCVWFIFEFQQGLKLLDRVHPHPFCSTLFIWSLSLMACNCSWFCLPNFLLRNLAAAILSAWLENSVSSVALKPAKRQDSVCNNTYNKSRGFNESKKIFRFKFEKLSSGNKVRVQILTFKRGWPFTVWLEDCVTRIAWIWQIRHYKFITKCILKLHQCSCGVCVAEESGVRGKAVLLLDIWLHILIILFYPTLTGRRNALLKESPKRIIQKEMIEIDKRRSRFFYTFLYFLGSTTIPWMREFFLNTLKCLNPPV